MASSTFTLVTFLLFGACTCKHIFVINSDLGDPEDDLVSTVVVSFFFLNYIVWLLLWKTSNVAVY